MPRNSSGIYALPAGNPVVSGTIIESSWANPTMTDIGTELTDSLSRSGRGGMLAALSNINGTKPLPAITFNNDTHTGLYLSTTGEIRMATDSIDSMRWYNNSVEVWDELAQLWVPILTSSNVGGNIETQVLDDGQTVVTFVNNVAGANIFINGPDADNGRLVLNVDYTYEQITQEITLTESRPQGSLISASSVSGFAPVDLNAPTVYQNIGAMIGADLTIGAWVYTEGGITSGDGLAATYLIQQAGPLGPNDEQLNNGNVAVRQTFQSEQNSYDNTTSGLTADNVQAALDEISVSNVSTVTTGDGVYNSGDADNVNVNVGAGKGILVTADLVATNIITQSNTPPIGGIDGQIWLIVD